jgi:hypothetical protein
MAFDRPLPYSKSAWRLDDLFDEDDNTVNHSRIWQCRVCAALTVDPKAHYHWHRAIGGLT